jgi:hypothetical protein
MTTRQRVAEELLMKEERISAWECYGSNSGLLDKDIEYCEVPKVEYWYLEE